MRSHRRLEEAPGLVDTDLTDEVRRTRTADGVGAVRAADHAAGGRAGHVEVAGLIVLGGIFSRERRRHALAEVGRVRELGDAGNGAAAADEVVGDVAGIVGPGRVELRHGLTHREAGELDEGVVHAERTGRGVAIGAVHRTGAVRTDEAGARSVEAERTAVLGSTRCRTGAGVVAGRPGEDAVEEGANHAVFGRGAGVDVQVFTSAEGVVVHQAVASTGNAALVRVEVRIGAQHGVSTQVTTQLDAGVGARDVVETGAVQRADLHVFDRLGLHGKIGCERPGGGHQAGSRAEKECLRQLH